MKLSVAIATYNEEANIGRCLKSVKDWVDEIVVVDGSSTDRTREIAKKLGARVYKTTNKPIFHINKQMAIDKCRGEWILQLDADEVVSEELKKEILEKLKFELELKEVGSKSLNESNEEAGIVAYWIPRKNFFLGRWLRKTGQYPDPVIRFFKKGKAWLPCKSAHEQMEVKGKTGWLKGHLLHYPYPSFSVYLKKSNRYTTLTAQELLEREKKPSLWGLFKAYLRAERDFWIRYLRCKGFLDGFPGFIFSLYSGLHHITAYIKFWELYRQNRKIDIKKDWE